MTLALGHAQVVSSRGPRHWDGMPLGSWWARVIARLIDTTPICALAVLAGSEAVGGLIAVAGTLALGLLSGLFGRTPGRALLGLRVTRTSGERLGAARGMARELAHYFDGLVLMLGFLWPLWDRRAQTFADKLVGSLVVTAR